MTTEEIEKFKDEIKVNIIPYILNLTDEKIKAIIDDVQKNNSDLPVGFSSMLYQQILIAKYNNRPY